jgi:nucleotide-binding universal stress UspA family protein
MLRRILIVLSAKKPTEHLVAHAIQMFQALSTKVTILSHLEVSNKRIDPLDWHIRKIEAETQLNTLAERLRATGIETQVTVSETLEPEKLIEYAQSNEVDLILVSKQTDNIDSMIHGLMKRTNIPILIVPQSGFLLNDDANKNCYQRILIPLDGSQRAEFILPMATFLAQTCQSQLILTHIIRKPEMPRHAPLTLQEAELAERIIESNRIEATHYLEQVAARLPGNVTIRLLVNDNIPMTIHRLAEEELIDLIMLSAHGYTGEPMWPYGSVTNSLIAYSVRPVLVVQDLPVSNSRPSIEQQMLVDRSRTRRA